MTLVTFISKNLQISKVFLETIFSHSRSEQVWKQNTKNDLLVLQLVYFQFQAKKKSSTEMSPNIGDGSSFVNQDNA